MQHEDRRNNDPDVHRSLKRAGKVDARRAPAPNRDAARWRVDERTERSAPTPAETTHSRTAAPGVPQKSCAQSCRLTSRRPPPPVRPPGWYPAPGREGTSPRAEHPQVHDDAPGDEDVQRQSAQRDTRRVEHLCLDVGQTRVAAETVGIPMRHPTRVERQSVHRLPTAVYVYVKPGERSTGLGHGRPHHHYGQPRQEEHRRARPGSVMDRCGVRVHSWVGHARRGITIPDQFGQLVDRAGPPGGQMRLPCLWPRFRTAAVTSSVGSDSLIGSNRLRLIAARAIPAATCVWSCRTARGPFRSGTAVGA